MARRAVSKASMNGERSMKEGRPVTTKANKKERESSTQCSLSLFGRKTLKIPFLFYTLSSGIFTAIGQEDQEMTYSHHSLRGFLWNIYSKPST